MEGKYTNHCTTGVLASSRMDKEDRDQDVGSCGSLTCLVYIVLVQSTPAENRTRILCCPLVLGRTRLGGRISLNTNCRFVRYIPQALRRGAHAKPKKDGRERHGPTERHGPSAREGDRADEPSEEAPPSPPPSLSVRASAVETKRKTETGTPADESPCVEGKVVLLFN